MIIDSTELISRQAAIDAIVNTVSRIGLYDNSEVARYGATFRQHEIIDIIESLPSAQPEIIRCKDCRFAALTYHGDCKYCQYLEGEFGLTDAVYFDGNDYCSHAERRTDG